MGTMVEGSEERTGFEEGCGVTAIKVYIGPLNCDDEILEDDAWDEGDDEDGEGCEDVEAFRLGAGGCCLGASPLGAEWPSDASLHDRRKLGRLGEELAMRYLVVRGYEILERNRRTPFGEADLVCRDGDDTVLVEVKTRLGEAAYPEEAVDEEKMRRYRKITLDYLGKNEDCDSARFDVVAINVLSSCKARIRHLVGVCCWES